MSGALLKLLGRLGLLLLVVAIVVAPMLAALDDPLAALRLFLFGPFSTLRNLAASSRPPRRCCSPDWPSA